MYEAEKKALQSQAMTAESSMAALEAKYTQLLGHTNSKQKIHHLDKLKQDIFNLRKVRPASISFVWCTLIFKFLFIFRK